MHEFFHLTHGVYKEVRIIIWICNAVGRYQKDVWCRYVPQYTRFSQPMKNVFRDMTPCNVMRMYKSVGGSCCLHNQAR
jgi:hypothetical protein